MIRWAAHSARISEVGHAPHLLGVGLEEEVEQALAEAVGHPLLEGVLAALGLDLRPHVGQERARQLDRAELLDHVRPAQRVVEELLVPVDARHARALEELLAHDLVPEVVDLLHLREEAVAAEVEAVLAARAVADLGLGDAADLVLGLEDDHRKALLGQQVAGGEARGAAAEDQRGRVTQPGGRGLDRRSVLGGVGWSRSSGSRSGRRSSCRGRRARRSGGPPVERRCCPVVPEALDPARAPGPTGRTGGEPAASRARPSRRCSR